LVVKIAFRISRENFINVINSSIPIFQHAIEQVFWGEGGNYGSECSIASRRIEFMRV